MIYLILAFAGGLFIFSIVKLLQQRRQKRLDWGAARQRWAGVHQNAAAV